eukprot:scaffold9290_cov63-Phaeocystis_antarctica.AAC.11
MRPSSPTSSSSPVRSLGSPSARGGCVCGSRVRSGKSSRTPPRHCADSRTDCVTQAWPPTRSVAGRWMRSPGLGAWSAAAATALLGNSSPARDLGLKASSSELIHGWSAAASGRSCTHMKSGPSDQIWCSASGCSASECAYTAPSCACNECGRASAAAWCRVSPPACAPPTDGGAEVPTRAEAVLLRLAVDIERRLRLCKEARAHVRHAEVVPAARLEEEAELEHLGLAAPPRAGRGARGGAQPQPRDVHRVVRRPLGADSLEEGLDPAPLLVE